MDQACRAAFLSSDIHEVQLRSLLEASRLISELDPEKTPPETATGIFRAVADLTENPDGFRAVKENSNKIVEGLYGWATEYISSSEDSFEAAVKVSLCGNIIDHGIFDDFDVEGLLKKETREPTDREAVDRFRNILLDSSRIVFLADNAGEIGLDALLLDEITRLCPEIAITVLVREAPVINDATLADAEYFEMERRFRIIETPAEVGVDIGGLSGPAAAAVREADWIISKGQANYERLSEKSGIGIIYLLRAKCGIVAENLGVCVNSPVIRIAE